MVVLCCAVHAYANSQTVLHVAVLAKSSVASAESACQVQKLCSDIAYSGPLDKPRGSVHWL